TSGSLWLTTSVFSRLLCVTSLQIALDRIEHRSRQLLRYPLPNRAALDQHGARYGLDGDVPAVARDPFRMILEAGRLPRGGCVPRRDIRRNRRAVDQHTDRDDQILVDGTLAVMKADVVFAEQDEIVRRRNFRDDRAAERAFGIARARAPLPVPLQRRRKAERNERQQDRGDAREDVTH